MPKVNKAEFDSEQAKKMSSSEIKKYMDEREYRFVDEYLHDGNATQAAIRAGYKAGVNNASAAVQASRLMRDERVMAYRAARRREAIQDMDVTRDNVVLKLMEIYNRCMSAEPVLTWDSEEKEWVNSGEWKFDARGAARALEQISKIMGFEAPVNHNIGGETFEEFIKSFGGGRKF